MAKGKSLKCNKLVYFLNKNSEREEFEEAVKNNNIMLIEDLLLDEDNRHVGLCLLDILDIDNYTFKHKISRKERLCVAYKEYKLKKKYTIKNDKATLNSYILCDYENIRSYFGDKHNDFIDNIISHNEKLYLGSFQSRVSFFVIS